MTNEKYKDLLQHKQEQRTQKNNWVLTRHEFRREILIAYEDVCRMNGVSNKWIDDEKRYNFYFKQLEKIHHFCSGLSEEDINFMEIISNDIYFPSARQISERHDILKIGRKATETFALPPKPESI